MTRQIILSWSGGKDSSLALAALRDDPRYEVVALLTSVTAGYDRISIHGVRRSLLEKQAESLGLPLFEVRLEPQSSNEAYEAAFLAGVTRVREAFPEVRAIAFGDLYLMDVRSYRERLVAQSGLEPMFPLWGLETKKLAKDFIARGFRAHLVCVDTTQLDGSFSGRVFDESFLEELPDSVDHCGEGGEFHTFVSAGPIFAQPIEVELGKAVLRESRFAYRELTSRV